MSCLIQHGVDARGLMGAWEFMIVATSGDGRHMPVVERRSNGSASYLQYHSEAGAINGLRRARMDVSRSADHYP